MKNFLPEVINVYTQSGDSYQLILEFKNFKFRKIDLKPYIEGEVFEPLKDIKYFKQVQVNPSSRTIAWPNGADLDPEFLYSKSEPLYKFSRKFLMRPLFNKSRTQKQKTLQPNK